MELEHGMRCPEMHEMRCPEPSLVRHEIALMVGLAPYVPPLPVRNLLTYANLF